MRTSLAYQLLHRAPEPLRRAIYLRLTRFETAELATLRFRLASQRWEREQAFRLLHDMYVRRGILDAEANRMRFSPYSVLPSTALFVCVRGTEVLGTLQLIEDSPIGLPMESTHPQEIAALRLQGRRLAEVGALAVTEAGRHKGIALLIYNLMFRWADQHRRLEQLAIAVHPSAVDFYTSILQFVVLGPTREYRSLKAAPSAPLALDLVGAPERFRRLYDRGPADPRRPTKNLYRFFVDQVLDMVELPAPTHPPTAPPAWTELDLRYFVEQLDARPRGIPPEQGRLLLHHHPYLSSVFNDDGSSRSSSDRNRAVS